MVISTGTLDGTRAATTDLITATAARADVGESAAATGTVAAADTYSLGFGVEPTAGSVLAMTSDRTWVVADVLVGVGDTVSTGQELARADTSDLETDIATLQADLGSARITLREAEADLAGTRADLRAQLTDARSAVETAKLSLRNAKEQRADAANGTPLRQARITFITATDQLRQAERTVDDLEDQLAGDLPDQTIAVSDAQSTVDDLEAQLADLQDALDRSVLRAPVDGVVTSLGVSAGFVAPTGPAVTLDSTALEVVADVVEDDLPTLAVGQGAVVSIDALGLDAAGTVTTIAPSTEATTDSVVTFPVTVTLDDTDARIKPGMSADVEITVASAPDAITVPAVALQGTTGSYLVQVATTDGASQPRVVEVGLVTETLAEITSGLSEGEAVVVGTSADRVTTDGAEQGGGFGGPGGLAGGFTGGPPPGGFGGGGRGGFGDGD